jgi:3-dehydroquinate dehydratase-2
MKILVIHGPNLNLLGKRDPAKYGRVTMDQINQELQKQAVELRVEIDCFQSNYEGGIIDFLQKDSSRSADGLIINPGALIRYSFTFRQALVDWGKPFIELHMSDINKTGVNTKINVLDDVPTRIEQVTGLKERSYYTAFERIVLSLRETK